MVRQFKPVMRVNNEVMMTINPDPVHLTLEDIVHDLTCGVNDSTPLQELLMWTKAEMKKELRHIANYRAYNYDGREWFDPYDLSDGYEMISKAVRAKVLKVFPEFETAAQMPEQFQEEYA